LFRTVSTLRLTAPLYHWLNAKRVIDVKDMAIIVQ